MTSLAQGRDSKREIEFTIKDKIALHNYYMPFISGGGLFIPKITGHQLGDELSIALNLMDEPQKVNVPGKVVWIAEKGVKNPHVPGVGVQFRDPDNVVKDMIETYLAGSIDASESTATM